MTTSKTRRQQNVATFSKVSEIVLLIYVPMKKQGKQSKKTSVKITLNKTKYKQGRPYVAVLSILERINITNFTKRHSTQKQTMLESLCETLSNVN